MRDLDYLQLLSTQYPNIATVSSEIINLKAILNLPRGTEHFLTDLHGEYEVFQHMLRTASGVLEFKIDEVFASEISEAEKEELTTLIFYPEDKLKLLKSKKKISEAWYKKILLRIIKICKIVSSKYSRSKVRKTLPENFSYVIEELLHISEEETNKKEYYNQIIDTTIKTGQAEKLITSLAYLIQTFAVEKLHIIGDIFDRGPDPHKIMDELKKHHNCDIQWGNHDILWMGAGLGQKSLLATVIRITLRYGNLKLLEEGYGINMRPLARFAAAVYGNSNCDNFKPNLIDKTIDKKEQKLITQMHKAITIIQLKLEGNLIKRRPEFNMNEELYLEKINYNQGVITLNGKEHNLTDTDFPTINEKAPYQLTKEEEKIINQLSYSFKNNEKLQEHIKFLFNKGSIYLKHNGNLLFHGCIPMDKEGHFQGIKINNKEYKGRELLDFFDDIVRKSYSYQFETEDQRDWLWYLWRGEFSPLFGKNKMTTFCRYFTSEESLYKEIKNSYYKLRETKEICLKILEEFNLDPKTGHIITGHTPVKEKIGESPVKGGGKLLVIDGGISAAYQPTTGIAGYTLISNSYDLRLVSHKPFVSRKKAIREGDNIVSSIRVVKQRKRQTVENTDKGQQLKERIEDLMELLNAYKKGIIKEKNYNI